MTELNEDQLNALSEELFERMAVTADNGPPMNDGATTPEAKEEIQSEAAKSLAKAEHDPIVPKAMTRQVWKQMMRMHFTVRRGKAQPCGHKLASTLDAEGHTIITSDPRLNCEHCWFTYFNTNGNMTNIADECFREAGRDVLERSRGKKFVKYFLMFMSTIARFQKEAAEKAAANGVETSGTEGTGVPDGASGGGDSTTNQSIGGVAGEARNIGGISEGSDPSIGSESPFDGSTVEGLGTGLSGL
jgi:hypothetical protein